MKLIKNTHLGTAARRFRHARRMRLPLKPRLNRLRVRPAKRLYMPARRLFESRASLRRVASPQRKVVRAKELGGLIS